MKPTKPTAPTADRSAFQAQINVILTTARDLAQRRDEIAEARRTARVEMATVHEALDKALLQNQRAFSDTALNAANAKIAELEPRLKQLEQFESNANAEIAGLDRQIMERNEALSQFVSDSKVRTFDELKSELPIEQIRRLYALYQQLPIGGFHWQYFIQDAGIVEPLGDEISPLTDEWINYFRIEDRV